MAKDVAASEYSIHLHVYADGDLFVVSPERHPGTFTTIEQLKVELLRLRRRGGTLLYSAEEPAPEGREKALVVSKLILDSDVDVQVVDPHPEAYGYQDSYAPYLEQALAVAEMDVDGLRRYLCDAKKALARAEPGSQEHQEREDLCDLLRRRLRKAKRALHKISAVHFALFVDSEDAE